MVRAGCPSGGEKTYDSVEQANQMADVMGREPRAPLGFLAILGGTLHREPRRRDRAAGLTGGTPAAPGCRPVDVRPAG